jgi:hypothetical protein
LEDQLALPQNDDMLFTFFGISLSPRRRSRMAEIKFAINNKNKIQRLIFGSDALQSDVTDGPHLLFRDIKDTHYPDRERYDDFDKTRRWEEHRVVHVNAKGIVCLGREWFAYLDRDKKIWDYTDSVDLNLMCMKDRTSAENLVQQLINQMIGTRLGGQITMSMVWHPQQRRYFLEVEPFDLASAIWFQFAAAIAEDTVYQPCAYEKCTGYVNASESRRSRKYCSDSCRTLAWRKQKQTNGRI